MDERPLDISEVATLTGYTQNYIHKLCHLRKIPYYRPGGGRVFFRREDVDAFIYRGKRPADFELADQADAILNRAGGRNGKR
jgi:excisionase family DNA binding protein